MVVISDIAGLESIDDNILKKVTGAHDLLFINIEDASIVGNELYDIDSSLNIPKYISKNENIKNLETATRNQIKEPK